MNSLFSGSDFGVFVFGREILKKQNTAHLSFEIKKNSPHIQEPYWEKGLRTIALQTKFGRIGIVHERKNIAAQTFVTNLPTNIKYTPREPRSETDLSIKNYETQILWELANEELADSVEFRRLARKYIRTMKHAHRDSLFFLDAILGEEKTRKILQHIAGTQIKLYFPSDFMEIPDEKNEKREISIVTDDDIDFTQKRAERILQTKLSQENIHRITNQES